MPTDRPAVSVRGVSRRYGPVHAVQAVDLEIARGELFGLIGHNGAGKTTLFKLMLGLVRPTGGSIEIDGSEVGGAAFRDVRRRVGYLPENVVFYDNLTGLETLRFFARLKGAPAATCGALLARVGLADAAGRRLREYSKGMRQRLGLAQALLGAPRLLFLDEPTTGLDPEGIRDFYSALRELKADGVTIVITSHLLAEIQQRVDRLAIMAAGRIRALGSLQALRAERELPVTIEVRLEPAALPRARAALAAFAFSADGDLISIACPREQRLAVLGVLSTLGDAVRDLQLHEPSLEDIFFGLGD